MGDKFSGVIGIDLGTTNSCVGVWQHNKVEIIPNEYGERTTPSWVSFDGDQRLVGLLAKRQATNNPQNTVFDAKRLMGKRFSEVEDDLDYYPFTIIPDHHGLPLIEVEYQGKMRQFKPEEISAMILSQMRQTAEAHLGQRVTRAVITVPAYFNDFQRQATKDAAAIAGLECLRIVNEPTAACLCYGLDKAHDESHVIVFDLGGGTFDVSLLCLSEGVFQVLSTNGDTHLGGEDIDRLLVDHVISQTPFLVGVDLKSNPKVLKKLQFACEQAKRHLSSAQQTHISIDMLYESHDLNFTLSRSKFEALIQPVLDRCIGPVKRVLKDADIQPEEVDEIVLVGGSTRIPRIQEMLSLFFNNKRLNKSINPDEAVAYGATVQGAILVDTSDESLVKDMILLDVAPLSLGIEASGGLMVPIIERNTNIPCNQSKMFTTIEDNQNAVLVQVFEGERKFTCDNHRLGTFELGPLPEAPRGVPKIKVTFSIDSNGILQVNALDKNTGMSTDAKLTQESGRLTQDQINRMINDSEQYKIADELKHAAIQELNTFERYLYSVQNSVNDPEINVNLSDEQISFVNQYVINTFQWINENREPPSSSEIIMQARKQVEHNLKPFMYQIYSRQGDMANMTNLPQEESRSSTYQGVEQINECIDQLDNN